MFPVGFFTCIMYAGKSLRRVGSLCQGAEGRLIGGAGWPHVQEGRDWEGLGTAPARVPWDFP